MKIPLRPLLRARRMALAFAMAALALAPGALRAHPADTPAAPETLVLFDPSALETPESIAFDRAGNTFISLVLTGEIRKIAPDGSQSTFAQLPIGPPLTSCGLFINGASGITIDPQDDTLYVSVAACDPENRGVWRITPDGEAEILATLPLEGIPNGIALHRGDLYVADSSLAVVWRVPAAGGDAEVWISSPLLAGQFATAMPLPGANGLQIFRQEVYVSNSYLGTILAIPFAPDGTAGEPRIHATLPAGMGCDDFAIDVRGSIYCTTDPANVVVRLDPDGTSQVLFSAADGLDGPSYAVFGRRGADRLNLYVANGAFPFFSTTHRPSLMRFHLDVPGEPPIW